MAADRALTVAYFSMEICLEQDVPTYSGGLGVLAGDTLRSAADLRLPVVGITLAHRQGYFRQHLASDGTQTEGPATWDPASRLPEVPHTVTISIEGRPVRVRAWRYDVRGVSDHVVPVYLLDTNLPENAEYDRTLTDTLYGGDTRYRLCQEVVLGIGGAMLLEQLGLGFDAGTQHHINEGHAALLCLHLLARQLGGRPHWEARVGDVEAVARRCIFTTHTPVPAGHDRFTMELTRGVLTDKAALLDTLALWEGAELNMTRLALRCSRFINGVAMRHSRCRRRCSRSSRSAPSRTACTRRRGRPSRSAVCSTATFPAWRRDNNYLRYAITIPIEEIRAAHGESKQAMLDEVERRTGQRLDPKVFTIGFARRATTYKRTDMIFSDLERLRSIAGTVGPIQIVYGGKAHPKGREREGDDPPHPRGGAPARRRADGGVRGELRDDARRVPDERRRRVAQQPDAPARGERHERHEGGTQRRALAVGARRVVDRGLRRGRHRLVGRPRREAARRPVGGHPELYYKLERVVMPLYYGMPFKWAEVQRNAIALNGSFFNTQRMVTQYLTNAYMPGAGASALVETAG
jgi:starch phosphorylase